MIRRQFAERTENKQPMASIIKRKKDNLIAFHNSEGVRDANRVKTIIETPAKSAWMKTKPRVPTRRANMRRFFFFFFFFFNDYSYICTSLLVKHWKENSPGDDFVSQLQQQTSCLSENSQIQAENIQGSRGSPSPIHSHGKRTSGRVIWNSSAAVSLPASPDLRLSNLPFRAACFPPSHRLRFVFMLGNQKQPVSLAAAS